MLGIFPIALHSQNSVLPFPCYMVKHISVDPTKAKKRDTTLKIMYTIGKIPGLLIPY